MTKRIFLDIETGGFKGIQSPLLSISWAKDQEKVESLYAKPTPGTQISRWSERKVWEQIKYQHLQNEQEILTKFLTNILENAPEGTQLVGWNIGYVAAAQESTKAGGFDLPMLISRAKKYGLDQRYRKAIKRLQIQDLGATYAYRIASTLAGPIGERLTKEGIVHPTLYQEAVGYMKQAISLQTGPMTETEIVEELSRKNIRFSGWKQDAADPLGLLVDGLPVLRRFDAAERLSGVPPHPEMLEGQLHGAYVHAALVWLDVNIEGFLNRIAERLAAPAR